MFTKILAATDKVTGRDSTVLTAKRVADKANAKLHIIHVLESASTKNRSIIRHYQTGEEIVTGPDYEEIIRDEIIKSYAGLLNDNGSSTVTIVAGFPWHEIIRYSRKISADLIVMGPHSTRAQEKKVVRIAGKVGSSAEEVIKREKCPVMLASEKTPKENETFKSVLVAIDFSKSCECALIFAAKLVQSNNAKLVSFHMLPIPPEPEYSQADYKADLNAAESRLRGLCPDATKGLACEYYLGGGALPHEEILKAAEQKNADLIVMGSHTKEKQGKWYAGSAVERVAYRSSCPVIVLTDPAVLKPWQDTMALEEKRGSDADRRAHVLTKNRIKL